MVKGKKKKATGVRYSLGHGHGGVPPAIGQTVVPGVGKDGEKQPAYTRGAGNDISSAKLLAFQGCISTTRTGSHHSSRAASRLSMEADAHACKSQVAGMTSVNLMEGEADRPIPTTY